HLGDERMPRERRERVVQLALQLPPALDQPLALEDPDVRDAGGADGGVARVGLPVADGVAALRPERLRDVPRDEYASERLVPARDALREGREVGPDAEALAADPAAEPAEARDHPVDDEQHARLL